VISQFLPHRTLSSSQISAAAEAFAAAQFALAGFDVLERAGRGRPYFDLAVASSDGMLKVSVFASFNGFWDVVDRYLDDSKRSNFSFADYHRAIDLWFENQGSDVTCCLVQFEPVALNRMPRIYLASAREVAAELHDKADQLSRDEIGLMGMDVVHRLEDMPSLWRFSQARLAQILGVPVEAPELVQQFSTTTVCIDCEKSAPSACASCRPLMN
jgi:hypothetical protein